MQQKITCMPMKGDTSAYNKEVLGSVMAAGRILLENGAEISRVEDTMKRISAHFGVSDCHFFVLSNGIFTTGAEEAEGSDSFARVQHIPVKGASLDKVIAVNQLSRDLDTEDISFQEFRDRLREIRQRPGNPRWQQVLASGFGSACFCYLFGGSVADSVSAFLAGVVLYLFLLWPGRRVSRIFQNVAGGALVTLICFLNWSLGLGGSWSSMIIGSIIPLIPGVPFTNGIRDIADGDYISGAVRLLDACLTFACIAIGVGFMFSALHSASGIAVLVQPSASAFTPWIIPCQVLASFMGTVAFALLYSVPPRYFLCCGLAGGIGWLIYSVLTLLAGVSGTVATFAATAVIVFLCRWFAVWKNCPATVFIITGIFPLVPGAGIFWTSCYLVEGLLRAASLSGFQSVKCAVAIVLAIVAVFELPYGLFAGHKKGSKPV